MKRRNTPAHSLRSALPASLAVVGFLLPVPTRDASELEPGTIQGKLVFQDKKGEVVKKAPRGVVVGDAVIYLVGDGLVPKGSEDAGDDPDSRGPKAVLDQVDITFVPHVLPVVAGTTVEMRNSDVTTHNIHTYPRKHDGMNKTQAPNGTMDVVYTQPDVIQIGCDIHSQMKAYVVVVPNEHFTMPKKDGSFTLSGIPPGEYELVVWHEKYGDVKQEVRVESGKTTEVEATLQEKARGGRRRRNN